jgi:hypothetical protein
MELSIAWLVGLTLTCFVGARRSPFRMQIGGIFKSIDRGKVSVVLVTIA